MIWHLYSNPKESHLMSSRLALFDSHVNLHAEQYEPDEVADIVHRAQAAHVEYMISISDKLSNTQAIKDIVARYPNNMWRTVGVHPHYASEYMDLGADRLIAAAQEEDVVGIGECGLDYYYEYSDRKAQKPVFDAHIEAAQATQLPLVIHTRDADEDMLAMLETAMGKKPFVTLLHCYTSGAPLARNVMQWGGYISFSGILSFKNAHEVRAIAEEMPMERIIIETDCPYLAPVPKRGRRNEPAYLIHVAEILAQIKSLPVEEIANITTENCFRLFSRANPVDITTSHEVSTSVSEK